VVIAPYDPEEAVRAKVYSELRRRRTVLRVPDFVKPPMS
jgi:hypothetical protein